MNFWKSAAILFMFCMGLDGANASEALGPKIELLGVKSGQVVFIEDFLIEGRITDASGIAGVWVNGDLLEIPQAKEIFFTKVAGPLKEGTNVLEIKAKNLAGAGTTEVITLIYTPAPQLYSEDRLAVAVPDFEVQGASPESDLAVHLRACFIEHLLHRGRFQVLAEREKELLQQILISKQTHEARVTDPRPTTLPAIMNADLMLEGHVQLRSHVVSLGLSVIDARTRIVKNTVTVHSKGTSPAELKEAALELAVKLEQAYPVVGGEIIATSPQCLATLTKDMNVQRGTEVSVFRKGPEVVLPNGRSLGHDFTPVGRAIITRVLSDYCEIEASDTLADPLQVGDRVRTR